VEAPPIVSPVAVSADPVLPTDFFVMGSLSVVVISPPNTIKPPSSDFLCCSVVARFMVVEGGSTLVVGCLQLVDVD